MDPQGSGDQYIEGNDQQFNALRDSRGLKSPVYDKEKIQVFAINKEQGPIKHMAFQTQDLFRVLLRAISPNLLHNL
jgi:hypothetical protein